jgi:hypothetical protein
MGTIGEVDAATVTIYPSAAALAADNDLRIASLAMAAYEYVVDCRSRPFKGTHPHSYLITLPAEYRLYKSANRRRLEALIHVPGEFLSSLHDE